MIKFTNDYIALEPYKLEDAKAEVRNGFATTKQKHGIAVLRVIFHSELTNGKEIKVGEEVMIKEELLMTQAWGKHLMRLSVNGEDKSFILVHHRDILGTL